MTVSVKDDIVAGVAWAVSRSMMLKPHEAMFNSLIVSCALQLLARCANLTRGLASAGSVNRQSFVPETVMVEHATLNGARLTSMEVETLRI